MHFILWQYQVKPEKKIEFKSIYSAQGAWAELFHQGAGYLGTELIRSTENQNQYVTIDRWESREAYEAFLSQFASEYKMLDAQCEGLTITESCIGRFESVS